MVSGAARAAPAARSFRRARPTISDGDSRGSSARATGTVLPAAVPPRIRNCLGLQGSTAPATRAPVFERLFREAGLAAGHLTDNVPPSSRRAAPWAHEAQRLVILLRPAAADRAREPEETAPTNASPHAQAETGQPVAGTGCTATRVPGPKIYTTKSHGRRSGPRVRLMPSPATPDPYRTPTTTRYLKRLSVAGTSPSSPSHPPQQWLAVSVAWTRSTMHLVLYSAQKESPATTNDQKSTRLVNDVAGLPVPMSPPYRARRVSMPLREDFAPSGSFSQALQTLFLASPARAGSAAACARSQHRRRGRWLEVQRSQPDRVSETLRKEARALASQLPTKAP